MTDIHEIKKKLKDLLPSDRYHHSLRVEQKALALAKKYRVSGEKTAIAALLHDCSRFMGREQMLEQALSWGLKPGPIERLEPKLLHAKLSAVIARCAFKITDRDILKAIERHTVGAGKMSRLDMIIYLADHIEADRDYKGVNKVRRLAAWNIDAAIVESTNSMIRHLIADGSPIFPEMIKTRNAHLPAGPLRREASRRA